MADFLIVECIIVLAIVGAHQAVHAIMGRPLPARDPVSMSPGVDHRDVWLWTQLHGVRESQPWRGIERRQVKPLTAASFETHRLRP